jgi:steroid delta-isomerase-like uncharacterized protein
MGVDNGAVARRYMTEIWGKGNLDVLEELVSPEIMLRDPMAPDGRGLQVVRERVRSTMASFRDISLSIDEIVVSGNHAIVRHTWRGVHHGEFFGFAGTGRTLTMKAVEVLRLSGGKVVENISYMDVYGMFQQLGFLPPPDRLAEALRSKTAGFAQAGAPRT